MLATLVWIVIAILGLVGILLYFGRFKKTGRWGWKLPTLPDGGESTNNFFLKYSTPAVLFVILCFVLWLTNDTLHWWSFLIHDVKAFIALVLTYFVFASAFMREKDNKKKAPFYQKVMVFTMVAAVDLALMGLTPSGVWNKYGLSNNTAHASTSTSAQVAVSTPSEVRRIKLSQEWSEEIDPLPGKSRFYCSKEGGWMAVFYDTAENPRFESGEPFPCPTRKAAGPHLGDNMTNVSYVFRSGVEKNTAVVY